MAVFAPPAPEAEFRLLCAMEPFDMRPVANAVTAQVGDMALEFFELSHPYPVCGVRVACEGKVFTYTGDTVMCPGAATLAHGADLLLCDGSFIEVDRTEESSHMSAAQAAMLARDNGVKKLIITHRLAHYQEGLHLSEAKAVFRNAYMAREMRSYLF